MVATENKRQCKKTSPHPSLPLKGKELNKSNVYLAYFASNKDLATLKQVQGDMYPFVNVQQDCLVEFSTTPHKDE